MLKTKGDLAHEITSFLAVDFDGWVDRKLYVLQGTHGLYRRVAESKYKELGERVVTALLGPKICRFVRDPVSEAEFVEAASYVGLVPDPYRTEPAGDETVAVHDGADSFYRPGTASATDNQATPEDGTGPEDGPGEEVSAEESASVAEEGGANLEVGEPDESGI